MIKGITIVRPAGTPEAYAKLASFFSALGFEGGRGWEEELSRGVSFLAPLGNLEFADGIAPSPAEIMVEVTGLEAVQAVARDWMIRNWGEQEAAHRLSAVTETHWKTRLFTVEPAPGHSIAFWEWDDPHKGKPVAVEGDLSAHGMRFAVVVSRWNAVITDRLLQGALDGALPQRRRPARCAGDPRAGSLGNPVGGAQGCGEWPGGRRDHPGRAAAR